MKKYEILSIGGGPAGITIAKILGKKMKVGIIRPEDHSMIYCAMPYVIENILPFEKTLKHDKIVTDADADLIRDTIKQVDFNKKTVTGESGESYAYEKLIIASGANPIHPKIEGHDLKGVYTFKTETELTNVLDSIKNGLKKALVIGAGAIGIELAQALNHAGIDTHLVDMTSNILPNLLDSEMAEEATEQLIKTGIHLHLNSKIKALKGEKFVKKVEIEHGLVINLHNIDDCSEYEESNDIPSMVVFAVGMAPTVNYLKNTELEIGRSGIIINDQMETNIKDVYAVGDCTEYISGIDGKVSLGKLATNAVPMARLLAHNLLGDNRTYKGFYNGAATKVAGLYAGGTGFTEKAAKEKFEIVVGYSKLTTAFPVMPFAKMVEMKIIVDRKTLQIVGGQVISELPVTDKVDLITMSIQNKTNIKDLAGFSYSSQPYQSFFPANNLLVACAEDIISKL